MDIYPDKSDRLLFETRSSLNLIRVWEKLNGFRYLTLDGVQHGGHIPGQTGRLILPYFKGAAAALIFLDKPRDYLFMGLGMAALPSFFRAIQPEAEIDIAEIDPSVTQTAKDWFGFREDALTRVHHGDGREFVKTTKKKYDAVFLDAYQELGIPSHMMTLEFMQEVRAVLKPGGVAVSNLWGSAVNTNFGPSVKTLMAAFEHLYQFRSYTYNFIFICDTKPDEIPAHGLLKKAKKADERYDTGFSLLQMVRRNYSKVEEGEYEGEDELRD